MDHDERLQMTTILLSLMLVTRNRLLPGAVSSEQCSFFSCLFDHIAGSRGKPVTGLKRHGKKESRCDHVSGGQTYVPGMLFFSLLVVGLSGAGATVTSFPAPITQIAEGAYACIGFGIRKVCYRGCSRRIPEQGRFAGCTCCDSVTSLRSASCQN